jgi:phosphatidyl-myo-inositol alpha-mannosyltransferase
MPVKLAVTHPYAWPEVRRGAERIVVETARSLAERGHDVTVLTSGEIPGRLRQGGVTTIKLRRRFRDATRHERWFGWSIIPYLVRGRFDVVHALMAHDALAACRVRRLTKHRVVYEELGSPFKWYWDTLSDSTVRRRLVREVDVYGCMSTYSLDVLKREWGRAGALIPGGVRMDEFGPAAHRHPRPTILYSGVLDEPRKGLVDLLGALDLLIEGYPDLQLWLSGPGNPGAVLATTSDRVRNLVTWLPIGEPDELSERYASAWVTTLPSEGDSFGMVLIESLASGTPIVVANDAAPPELVTPSTGAIAEPHNPRSLAEALEVGLTLAADRTTSSHCRDFARHYDWDTAIAPLLEKLYLRAP